MNKVPRASLFTRYGSPIRALENALFHFGVRDLEELEALVNAGEISQSELFRLRGCGSKLAPGRLARYLFSLPSGEEQKKQRIFNNLGDGI